MPFGRKIPFGWNQTRVKRSPFKTLAAAKLAEAAYKRGRSIGFTRKSSLKSMGRIPRSSGTYALGVKYT